MAKRSSWIFAFFFGIIFCCFQLSAEIIIQESCPDGFSLEAHLRNDRLIRQIIFSDGSRVDYEYSDKKLSKIVRYDSFDNEIYAQTYRWNGSQLESQTGWFTTTYSYDDSTDKMISKSNPWHQETIEYNSVGQAVRIGDRIYTYDALGQITAENDFFHAEYDQDFNLIKLNEQIIAVNERNQIIGSDHDLNGNRLLNDLFYGEHNLISEALGEKYFYNSTGRLVQKGNTSYLYLGYEEIASFENGQCKTLKIPGIGGPIAIEIDGKPYAPVVDCAGIIRKLIDPITGSIYKENDCDIFGGGLTEAIPYAYRGKRYDSQTNLIYFGRRFYDPSSHRWLTPDPLGSIDHENLYQYVYNNPLKYCDPTGGGFWGYMLGIGEIVAGGAIMLGGVGLEVVSLGGFTLAFGIVEGSGLALLSDGLVRATRASQDIERPRWNRKYETHSQWKEVIKKPPRFNGADLGSDPTECPAEGFEWRGSGSPETGRGNWINPITEEKLHPDLWHPDPKGPHWGYKDPEGIPYDLFPDGSWQ